MAVYTHLSAQLVSNMAAVFPEIGGDVVDVEGIPWGSINTTYKVTTRRAGARDAVWFLRVNEGKSFDALLHERDVLLALAHVELGAETPRMALSVPGGSFFPVDGGSADGGGGARKWACFFPALPGRDLGVFEVTPAHTAQVGGFLARAHHALRAFPRRRRNPYGIDVVGRWLADLARHRDLPATVPDTIARLTRTRAELRRRRRPLTAGLIHGDLFVDNSKWEDGTLRAVFDWEMAGRDHLVLDVAVAVCAWCFARGPEQPGSGDGAAPSAGTMALRDDAAAALVDGYQRVRRFTPAEQRGFFTELRLAALRFTASRIRDFEVPRAGASERRYLDHRDFLARLDVVEGRGQRELNKILGLR